MLNTATFQQHLKELFTEYSNAEFLLAVSGGADSMVLLHLFKSAGLNFQVAHINYKLRGSNSDDDQKIVESICYQHNIPFHLYQVSEKDNKPRNSIQDWARIIRYDFFRTIQKKQKLDFIVTAHHLNDQLETFLIHLSKASGIKGLSGIPANENTILRPLLNFSKQEIYDFARENNIEFREDLSNQKSDYLRNKIRLEIVPKLLEINDQFLQNFSKSISYINQTKDFVEEKIAEIEEELLIGNKNPVLLNKERFFNQEDFVQFEILRKYGFNDLKEMAKMRKAEPGKKFISSDYVLLIDRENISLEKIGNEPKKLLDQEITLEFDTKSNIILPQNIQEEIKELGSFSWRIDAEKTVLPLKLRRKKAGDIFYPMGMIGKKKIAKFFKDEKIPILAQQKIWLLCDGKDHVIGVIPYRQDRKFTANKESERSITIKS